MVDLMDGSVERSPVESTVRPVVPCVLHNKEDSDLVGHLGPCGEGNTSVHAEVFAHRVKEPNLGELDSEVGEKDHLCASPLLFCGWYFFLHTFVSSYAATQQWLGIPVGFCICGNMVWHQ